MAIGCKITHIRKICRNLAEDERRKGYLQPYFIYPVVKSDDSLGTAGGRGGVGSAFGWAFAFGKVNVNLEVKAKAKAKAKGKGKRESVRRPPSAIRLSGGVVSQVCGRAFLWVSGKPL